MIKKTIMYNSYLKYVGDRILQVADVVDGKSVSTEHSGRHTNVIFFGHM